MDDRLLLLRDPLFTWKWTYKVKGRRGVERIIKNAWKKKVGKWKTMHVKWEGEGEEERRAACWKEGCLMVRIAWLLREIQAWIKNHIKGQHLFVTDRFSPLSTFLPALAISLYHIILHSLVSSSLPLSCNFPLAHLIQILNPPTHLVYTPLPTLLTEESTLSSATFNSQGLLFIPLIS